MEDIFENKKGEVTNTNVESKIFLDSFPTAMHSDVSSLLDKLYWKREHNSTECFPVKLGNEIIKIPYRIYYEEQTSQNLTNNEVFVLDCIFTRHHDGHVRERRLRNILAVDSYVATPFITQLLGEYVVEILNVIKSQLTPNLIDNLIKLKLDNPRFFRKTEQRVQSYWNCYYKRTTRKADYVGFQILQTINQKSSI